MDRREALTAIGTAGVSLVIPNSKELCGWMLRWKFANTDFWKYDFFTDENAEKAAKEYGEWKKQKFGNCINPQEVVYEIFPVYR